MINKCGKISGCICVLCSVTIHAAHAHLYATVYQYKCSYMITFSEALIYNNAKRLRQYGRSGQRGAQETGRRDWSRRARALSQ